MSASAAPPIPLRPPSAAFVKSALAQNSQNNKETQLQTYLLISKPVAALFVFAGILLIISYAINVSIRKSLPDTKTSNASNIIWLVAGIILLGWGLISFAYPYIEKASQKK